MTATSPHRRTTGAVRTPRSVPRSAKFMRTPQLVVVGTIQGAMFLLIFRYVFGGAIDGGSACLRRLPRARLHHDHCPVRRHERGRRCGRGCRAGLPRPLALPPDPSRLGARRAGAGRNGAARVDARVTTAIGFAVGFRLHGSIGQALGAFALCLLFGFAFSWLFVLLGLIAGTRRQRKGCRCSSSPSCSSRARTCPPTRCPARCGGSPIINRSRRWSTRCDRSPRGRAAEAALGHSASYYVLLVAGVGRRTHARVRTARDPQVPARIVR